MCVSLNSFFMMQKMSNLFAPFLQAVKNGKLYLNGEW